MYVLFVFLFFSLKRTVSQTPYEAGFISGFFCLFQQRDVQFSKMST